MFPCVAHFVKITFQPRQYNIVTDVNESEMKMKLMECSLRADNFSHAGERKSEKCPRAL